MTWEPFFPRHCLIFSSRSCVLLDSLCSGVWVSVLLKGNWFFKIIIRLFIHLLLNRRMVLLCCCLAQSDSKDPLLQFYSASIIVLMQLSREVVILCLERQNLMFKTYGTKGGCYFYPASLFLVKQVRWDILKQCNTQYLIITVILKTDWPQGLLTIIQRRLK